MKQSTLACAVSAALLGASVFVGSAQAAPRLCDDGSRPPCKDTGEATPTNNLAYPVIWSDGVSIVAPLPDTDWTFAQITDPASQCFTGDTGGTVRSRPLHHIHHTLDDPARDNAVLGIEGLLFAASSCRLIQCALHGARDFVRIENGTALHVACCTSNRLDQRIFRAQETLFVGIEDGDQRHLWHVQPLAQQIDADQDIKKTQSEITNDFAAFNGINIRMQVTDFDTMFLEVFGQILGHALGERGNEHALAIGNATVDLR